MTTPSASRRGTTTHRPAARRFARRRRAVFSVSIALLAALVALPFLARHMALLAARDPTRSLPITTMIDDGVYLATGDGYLHLDAWNMPLRVAPDDAVRVPRSAFESIAIHRKVLEAPSHYRLLTVPAGASIDWTTSARGDRWLRLEARSLEPGTYVLVAPTTSFYGGETFHYFELTGP